jgi:hypothetical protein
MFVGGPDAMEPGDTAEVKLALMYFPDCSYHEVQPGATFTVREGPLIVGSGVSLSLESFPLRYRPPETAPLSINERRLIATCPWTATPLIRCYGCSSE